MVNFSVSGSYGSSLTERRGLKYGELFNALISQDVVSHRETWIEIVFRYIVNTLNLVVSHRETWIEIANGNRCTRTFRGRLSQRDVD